MTAKEAYEIAKAKNDANQQAFESKVITSMDDAIERNALNGAYSLFMRITNIDSYDVSNILQHYINLGYGVENKTDGIKLCWDIKTGYVD